MSKLWWRFWTAFGRLFDDYKIARRLTLFWACWLITVVSLRATESEVITKHTAAGATIITGVIGILATVVGFYIKSRKHDDLRSESDSDRSSDSPAGR